MTSLGAGDQAPDRFTLTPKLKLLSQLAETGAQVAFMRQDAVTLALFSNAAKLDVGRADVNPKQYLVHGCQILTSPMAFATTPPGPRA